MKKTEWVCCFCGQEIHPSLTDPCYLDLSTAQDRNEVQELTCHSGCLNNVLHPDFQVLAQV